MIEYRQANVAFIKGSILTLVIFSGILFFYFESTDTSFVSGTLCCREKVKPVAEARFMYQYAKLNNGNVVLVSWPQSVEVRMSERIKLYKVKNDILKSVSYKYAGYE